MLYSLLALLALASNGPLFGNGVCPQQTRVIDLPDGSKDTVAYCESGGSVYYLPPMRVQQVYYIASYRFTVSGDRAGVYDVELSLADALGALRQAFEGQNLIDASSLSLEFQPNTDVPFAPVRINKVNAKRVILRFDELGSEFYLRQNRETGGIRFSLILQSTFSVGNETVQLRHPIVMAFDLAQATPLRWVFPEETPHPAHVQEEIEKLLREARFNTVRYDTAYGKEQKQILERLLEIEVTYLPADFWEPVANFYGEEFNKEAFIRKLLDNIADPVPKNQRTRSDAFERAPNYYTYLNYIRLAIFRTHLGDQLERDLLLGLERGKDGLPVGDGFPYLRRLGILYGTLDGTLHSDFLGERFAEYKGKRVFDGRRYDYFLSKASRDLEPGYFVLFFNDARITARKKKNWVRIPARKQWWMGEPRTALSVANDAYLDPEILTQLREFPNHSSESF